MKTTLMLYEFLCQQTKNHALMIIEHIHTCSLCEYFQQKAWFQKLFLLTILHFRQNSETLVEEICEELSTGFPTYEYPFDSFSFHRNAHFETFSSFVSTS